MAEQFVRVRPPASDEYLANPHKGCCTFQHFNGDELFPGTTWSEAGPTEFPPPVTAPKLASGAIQDLVVKGYLPTTVAYCRWFWEIMEPERGHYDFSVIEKALATAGERGQRLAFRAMAFGGCTQPMVPKWYRDKYPMVPYSFPGFEQYNHLMPDPNSPEYLEHWGRFIRELGRRFDGHPLVENYTPAFIGPWGEGDAAMSDDQITRFVDVFCEAFPRTIKIWEFTGNQMPIGLRRGGGGWRLNSYGDLGNVGSDAVTKDVSWNHHYDAYPQWITASGVTEAWKKGPVFFESGWVPMAWYKLGHDLDFILQQGLKFHMTYFMPKYTYLPDAWIDKLGLFCRRIGYRYVLRQDRPVAVRVLDRERRRGAALSPLRLRPPVPPGRQPLHRSARRRRRPHLAPRRCVPRPPGAAARGPAPRPRRTLRRPHRPRDEGSPRQFRQQAALQGPVAAPREVRGRVIFSRRACPPRVVVLVCHGLLVNP